MAEVKAFVARSFAEEDEEVFHEISKLLNSFQASGLEWEDASVGRQGQLHLNVQEVANTCTVFIGIITRKHALCRQSGKERDGRSLALYWDRILGRRSGWMSSGWTLQESGYAIGKKMDLILLVEDGIVDIGGLQGGLQVITFNRLRVTESFAQLSAQLNDLLKRTRSSAEASIPAVAEAVVDGAQEKEHRTPDSGETGVEHPRKDFWQAFGEMLKALGRGEAGPNLSAAETHFKRALELAATPEDREVVEVDYVRFRLHAGDSTAPAALARPIHEVDGGMLAVT